MKDATRRQNRRGSVDKSRQRRSRLFSVLTYYTYAPRVKMAAALPRERRVSRRGGWAANAGFFEPTPQPLIRHLILGKFAREHLHYSTLPTGKGANAAKEVNPVVKAKGLKGILIF